MVAASRKSGFEVLSGAGSSGPRPEAGGVGLEVNRQNVALVFSIAIAVLCAHPLVTAASAEPANTGEAVVIEQQDIEFAVFLHSGDDFLRHHQVRTVSNQDVHFAIWTGHFRAQPASDLIAP